VEAVEMSGCLDFYEEKEQTALCEDLDIVLTMVLEICIEMRTDVVRLRDW
jgi:hypothetical protein